MITLIGRRCKARKRFSRAVLIGRSYPHTSGAEALHRIMFVAISAPGFPFAGVLLMRVPPLPIPNRAVKAREPNDTRILAIPGK